MVKGDLGADSGAKITSLKKRWQHTMKRIEGLMAMLPGFVGGLATSLSSVRTSGTFPIGHIYGQRLAKTSRGYLALAPHDTETGDKVALLAGGKSPLVLRGDSRGWKLVGDCYIEGLMRGEQWKAQPCKELNLI
ncbi:hypothetical protein F5Y10DRAFT_286559 [Nemania abortiva]|nr:hypothetical protein F5Y10DRAFT_286559 [Nemania abortiva]